MSRSGVSSACSVCRGAAAVIMFDIEFCGACFAQVSEALRRRLSHDELTFLSKGHFVSPDVRLVVSIVLGQMFKSRGTPS